ncbi:MAG TPA: GFA family protein [Xanthobacteraceae bacterium]|nr:GFA family protein [Xanthobacteraceae bacterium]
MAASGPARLTGGCQCGAIRYEIASPRWTTVCHCRMCQKASGQPFMVFVGGPAENLRWTRGAPRFFASSDIAERGFCAACGTPLTYGRPGAATLSVTLGSLDDPAAVQPSLQNGIEAKLGWVDALASLPARTTADWLREAGICSVTSRQHGGDES